MNDDVEATAEGIVGGAGGESLVQRCEFARCLLDRHARTQPADQIDLALRRDTESTISRNRSRRRPDLDTARVIEIGSYDTNDDGRLFVDSDPPADDIRHAAEVTAPVSVTNDRDRLRSLAIVAEPRT